MVLLRKQMSRLSRLKVKTAKQLYMIFKRRQNIWVLDKYRKINCYKKNKTQVTKILARKKTHRHKVRSVWGR